MTKNIVEADTVCIVGSYQPICLQVFVICFKSQFEPVAPNLNAFESIFVTTSSTSTSTAGPAANSALDGATNRTPR